MTRHISRGTLKEVVVEEAAFLLSCGESPEQVALMLNSSLSGIAKACRRAGNLELARLFDRARDQTKKWAA